MVVAELKLTRRAHHAAAFDSANGRDLQREVGSGNVCARRAEHADQPGTGIGRATHDLDFLAGAGVDVEHLELVGLRMLFRGQHLRHHERLQRFGGIGQAFDLEADRRQLVCDLLG